MIRTTASAFLLRCFHPKNLNKIKTRTTHCILNWPNLFYSKKKNKLKYKTVFTYPSLWATVNRTEGRSFVVCSVTTDMYTNWVTTLTIKILPRLFCVRPPKGTLILQAIKSPLHCNNTIFQSYKMTQQHIICHDLQRDSTM